MTAFLLFITARPGFIKSKRVPFIRTWERAGKKVLMALWKCYLPFALTCSLDRCVNCLSASSQPKRPINKYLLIERIGRMNDKPKEKERTILFVLLHLNPVPLSRRDARSMLVRCEVLNYSKTMNVNTLWFYAMYKTKCSVVTKVNSTAGS